ncbi:hypothetical protein SteCoe_33289 [Stentor coeruleus]|uniref:Uncharacterized protein n=1 Tax=Stentor coeruleus TaxID=5963 RepID=A0A1R2AX46_9CILI|nr:hypothetical protein SteCoe_33289 [Stentor coeruleus]
MINNIVSFNKLAMENLAQSKLEMAYHFMHRAEKLLNDMSESIKKNSLTLITCNNQACLYKALGKSFQARIFLEKTITMQTSTPEDHFNLARCLLNLSLLKAEENNSDKALMYALRALDILTKYCEPDTNNYYENICTAFNIIGTQHKIRGNDDEANRVFKRGLDISEEFLGSLHQLTINFRKNFEQKKYKFVRKPKSSKIFLPRIGNRGLPLIHSSAKQKTKSPRITLLEFSNESKLPTQKRIFKKLPRYTEKQEIETSVEIAKKTLVNFLLNETLPIKLKPKKLDKKVLDILSLSIQTVFRRFLVQREMEEIIDSRLTRRQLAEKKAVIVLQEFKVLKERASKEKPFFEHTDFRSSKLQSRRGTG